LTGPVSGMPLKGLLLTAAVDAFVCLAALNYYRRAFDISGWLLAVHLPLVIALLLVSFVLAGLVLRLPWLGTRRTGSRLAAAVPGAAVGTLLLLYLADLASNLWMGGNITHKLVGLWISDWWGGGNILPVSPWLLLLPLAVIGAAVAAHIAVSEQLRPGLVALIRVPRGALAISGVLVVVVAYGFFFQQLSWRTPRSQLLSSDPILALMRTTLTVQDERQLANVARLAAEEPICRAGYRAGPAVERKHVIVVVVDSLRADHMGVYGYERPNTPFLSSLAASGRLRKVDFATSTCAESNCGILSMLFSKTLRHQVPQAFKLYDLLHDQGYRTNFILSGNHDWQGLREMYGNEPTFYFDGRDARDYGRSDDRLIFEGLDAVPDAAQPAFFFFHLMSVHLLGDKLDAYRRYQPSAVKNDWDALFAGEYDRETVTNNYDNGVLQADATIERLFGELDRKGYLQNSIIAIVSDHGEGLGDRGPRHFGHITSLYQEFIRIPMLIYDPSPTVYGNLQFATQVDVAPTLVSRLGMPIPACWEGTSLLEPSAGRQTFHQTSLTMPCYAVIDRSTDRTYKYMTCSMGRREDLYDLTSDPGETVNLIEQADPALVERLRASLTDWREK
jgi:glucan phosphoethanolaminetransferase (alkaline phosphatase superfamily)